MIHAVELSQFAVDDLAEIVDWDKDHREGLDKEFLAAFGEALKQIETNPLAFQARYKQSRSVLLRRFPYNVIFKVFGDKVKIAGVVHHARNPQLTRKRLT